MNLLLKSVLGCILIVILSIIKLKVDGFEILPIETVEEKLREAFEFSKNTSTPSHFTEKLVAFLIQCNMRGVELTQEYFPLDIYQYPVEARMAVNDSYISITDEMFVELKKGIRSCGLVLDLEVGIEVVRLVCQKLDRKAKSQSEIFQLILKQNDIPIVKHSAEEFKLWYTKVWGDPLGVLTNTTETGKGDDENATIKDEPKKKEKDDQAQKVTPLDKSVEDKIDNAKADLGSNKESAEKHELR